MRDFPNFMKNPKNRVKQSSENRKEIEGYVYDGIDGSQKAFWTCYKDKKTEEHVHKYNEYLLVIQGQYKLKLNNKTIILNSGDEIYIPSGVLHSGERIAGTRIINAFGAKRLEREN